MSADSFASADDFEGLMARGQTGDAAVLPAIMQLLSTGGSFEAFVQSFKAFEGSKERFMARFGTRFMA